MRNITILAEVNLDLLYLSHKEGTMSLKQYLLCH